MSPGRRRRRGRGRRGQGATAPSLEVIQANLKMRISFVFRDHTNPIKKKREIFVKSFFFFSSLRTAHYNLEIFCFEHSGRFFPPHQTVFLSYGYGSGNLQICRGIPANTATFPAGW